MHKFEFQWDLLSYMLVCTLSLSPFWFSGRRLLALIPLSVWACLNALFMSEGRQVPLPPPLLLYEHLLHKFK